MSKPQDGFISRFLNRPISRRITRFLLKFPIHPNAWTISIFALPLIASVFLLRGNYISIVIGAAIFQAFSILDGCDGEIARARNLESKFGERFVWWLFQLTKRDMALVVFLMLALLGLAPWILHLWATVAGASLVLSALAVIRGSSVRGDIVTREPRS